MPIAYPYKFSDWYGYDQDCGGLPKFNSSLVSTAGSVCSATIITNKYCFNLLLLCWAGRSKPWKRSTSTSTWC